ncbi:MAG: hypothetical protein R3F20_13310 [Planctomycetota bacterium]
MSDVAVTTDPAEGARGFRLRRAFVGALGALVLCPPTIVWALQAYAGAIVAAGTALFALVVALLAGGRVGAFVAAAPTRRWALVPPFAVRALQSAVVLGYLVAEGLAPALIFSYFPDLGAGALAFLAVDGVGLDPRVGVGAALLVATCESLLGLLVVVAALPVWGVAAGLAATIRSGRSATRDEGRD